MKNRKIRTIVVEDEILLLKNIEKKIHRADAGFEVVGSAYNGKEALELIEKQNPDVVFTDIRMPIMDGLELARIVREEYPSVAVVIVSGYSDFEYARTAIRYEVCNYLLKPVREKELLEVLDALKQRILVQAEEKARKLLEAQIFYGKTEPGLEELYRYLEGKQFGMFLVCVGNLRIRSKKAKAEAERSIERPELSGEIFDRAGISYAFGTAPNQWLILLEGNPETWTETESCVRNWAEQAFLGATINIVYTERPAGWNELHQAYQQARQQLFERLIIGESHDFSNELPKEKGQPAVLSTVMINYLQTVLNSGSREGVGNAIRQLFEEWEEKRMSQQCIEKLLHQILILFQQNLFFSEEDYDRMFQNVFGYLEEESDLSHAAVKIEAELSVWSRQKQTVPSEIEEAIEQMDAYIRKHYTEQINLSELSEEYHFNHSYMTRLFKKLKGQTPMKLINALRMADAKKMLKNSALSVREISETLGFADQHYFSRIFKETTGTTPKEFRAEHSSV